MSKVNYLEGGKKSFVCFSASVKEFHSRRRRITKTMQARNKMWEGEAVAKTSCRDIMYPGLYNSKEDMKRHTLRLRLMLLRFYIAAHPEANPKATVEDCRICVGLQTHRNGNYRDVSPYTLRSSSQSI